MRRSERTVSRHTARPRKPGGEGKRVWPSWVAVAAVLCGLAALQAYLIIYRLPYETFYSGDCGVKLLQVQSLASQHWHSLALVYPGEKVDPQHRFVETGGLVVRRGRVFGAHSAAFALASSLPYAWFGYGGLYLIPAASLLGTVLLLFLVAKQRYGPWRALLAAGIAGVCSPLLFYGLEFWEHTLATVIVMAAVFFLTRAQEREPRPWQLLAAGGLLAAAFSVRPESAVFFAALTVALAVTLRPFRVFARSVAFLSSGYAAVLLPVALFNQWVFGDPWGTLLGLHLRGGHPDPRVLVLTKLLTPLSIAALCNLLCAMAAAFAVYRLRSREARAVRGWQSAGLTMVAVGAMATIAATEGWRSFALWRRPAELTSLADTFPLIWALPVVIATWHRTDPEAHRGRRFLGLSAAAYIAGVLAVSPTWGGAQWGPRQLLPVVPLLCLLATCPADLRRASGRVAVLSVCTLALLSLTLQVSGVRFLGEVKWDYVHMVRRFAGLTERGAVIVSDQFFFQEVLAPIYYQRVFLYLSSPKLSASLVQTLRASGRDHCYFFFPRGRESSGEDLLTRLNRYRLLDFGLVIQRAWTLEELPYYFVRLGIAGPGAGVERRRDCLEGTRRDDWGSGQHRPPARPHDKDMLLVFSNGVGVDDDEIRTGDAMVIDPYERVLCETPRTGGGEESAGGGRTRPE